MDFFCPDDVDLAIGAKCLECIPPSPLCKSRAERWVTVPEVVNCPGFWIEALSGQIYLMSMEFGVLGSNMLFDDNSLNIGRTPLVRQRSRAGTGLFGEMPDRRRNSVGCRRSAGSRFEPDTLVFGCVNSPTVSLRGLWNEHTFKGGPSGVAMRLL